MDFYSSSAVLALVAKQPNLMVEKNTNLLFLMKLWTVIVDWAQLGSPDLGSALLFLVRGGGMAGTPHSTWLLIFQPAGWPELDDMVVEGFQA